MATSISKSVNYKQAAAAPDYQVAARPVDTFVSGSGNDALSKGRQVAAALEQASGALTQVGKELEKKKKEKQLAEFETTNALIKEDLKNNPTKRLVDSDYYNELSPALQARVAMSMGVDDADAMIREMQAAYDENPNIALDDAAFETFLNGYNVAIDSENGINIHRQASQLDAVNAFKKKLRGTSSIAKRDHRVATLKDAFGKEVGAILQGKGTSAEKWDLITAADAGETGLDNLTRKGIIYQMVNDYATQRGDARILNNENIKAEYFKSPELNLLREAQIEKIETDKQLKRTRELNLANAEAAAAKREALDGIFNGTLTADTEDKTRIQTEALRNHENKESVGTETSIVNARALRSNMFNSSYAGKDFLRDANGDVITSPSFPEGVPMDQTSLETYVKENPNINPTESTKLLAQIKDVVKGYDVDRDYAEIEKDLDRSINDFAKTIAGKTKLFNEPDMIDTMRRRLKRFYRKEALEMLTSSDSEFLTPAQELELEDKMYAKLTELKNEQSVESNQPINPLDKETQVQQDFSAQLNNVVEDFANEASSEGFEPEAYLAKLEQLGMIEQFRDRLEAELAAYDSQIEKYGKVSFDRTGAKIPRSSVGIPKRKAYENYIETIRAVLESQEE